jgi:hypothetical protein
MAMWNVADAARGCMVSVGRVFAVRDIAYPRFHPIGADLCGGANYANGAIDDTIVAADCYPLGHI